MVINSWSLHRRWQRLQRPLAVVLVAVGGFLLWAQDNAPPAAAPTVVAVADVPAGQRIEPSDVEVVQWPIAHRPSTAADSADDLIGRSATAAISAGEPLTAARVAGPTALAGAGAGMVAVLLPEDAMTRSGLIRPGDKVNVVGQSQAGPRTLVTGATVLSITDQGIIAAIPATSAGPVVQAAATKSAAVVLLSSPP